MLEEALSLPKVRGVWPDWEEGQLKPWEEMLGMKMYEWTYGAWENAETVLGTFKWREDKIPYESIKFFLGQSQGVEKRGWFPEGAVGMFGSEGMSADLA